MPENRQRNSRSRKTNSKPFGDAIDLTDQHEQRLAVLKALGDDTRFTIFWEIARSPVPLATAEIAGSLNLHVNTVRPHLERMRDVGILRVETGPKGAIGRPQHRYSLAPGAPTVGLRESAYAVLARGLLLAAVEAGVDADFLVEAGRLLGREAATRGTRINGLLATLVSEQARYGFDPVVDDCEDERSPTRVVHFHCPFPDLAASNPEMVCGFHRGMVDGLIVECSDGQVDSTFSTILDDDPCRVELAAR